MILLSAVLVPLVFALATALGSERHAKTTALVGASLQFVVVLALAGVFDWGNGAAFGHGFIEPVTWFAPLGLKFNLGVDAIAVMLLMLTGLLGPICVLCSWTAITERPRTFYSWLLVLQAAMAGVFCARDVILFYIFFEFTLVPMFILISLWGSTNRKKAAIKFFLYTFTGSVIALAGLVYIAWFSTTLPGHRQGVWTFDIGALQEAATKLPRDTQGWVLLALMCGFAVKVPLFPLHTWLPLAHTEAPTAGSVILAGVLLKLGTYALYRFVLPFVPMAVMDYAPMIAVLCIIGILYGGLICWVQTDVKKLVAYSSVAHLGFCVLGLFALNNTGVSGSILYMINHGLSTGALFLLIGMIYERYHTRDMKQLGGLAAKMPVWAFFMVFFAMASVGLPGLNGFVSEFLCLLGTFQSSSAWGSGLWGSLGQQPGQTTGVLGPWFAAIAGVGMIIAAMYLLYMVGRVVWGPLVEPKGHGGHGDHEHAGDHGSLPRDLNLREIGILVPLAILCLVLGVYPKPALNALQPGISASLAAYDKLDPMQPTAVPATRGHAAAERAGEETP